MMYFKGAKYLLHVSLVLFLTLCVTSYSVASSYASSSSYSRSPGDSSGGNDNPFRNLLKTDDLWKELGHQMTLPHEAYRPEVQERIQWFVKHPKYVYELANNAKPYMYYVLQQVDERHLPAEIALMPMVESAYDPFGVSVAGAVGLWQMMGGTASGFGLKINWWYDGRRDVVDSTDAALNFLSHLESFFNGNWILAIAAYDSGEGTVLRALQKNIAQGKSADFWALPLPSETKTYIPKLLALAEIISHPDKYSIKLPPIKNEPYMVDVDVGSQIDLQKAAELSDISLEQLVRLNPGYNRWATAPDGPYHIVVPVEKAELFKQKLAELPEENRVTWQRYDVQSGDSLIKIANQFHTSASLLRSVNKLDTDTIIVGDVLFVPLSTKTLPESVIQSARQYSVGDAENIPGPKKVVHVVKSGESMWSIAQRYGVQERAISFWNNLKAHAVLQPGDKLTLWLASHSKAKAASDVKVQLYTIRQGDSLARIAKRFNTQVGIIRKINTLDSDVLQPGQMLTVYKNLSLIHLPVDHLIYYTVKSGDMLDKIAFQYNTNSPVLKVLNGLDSSLLHVGQKLIVVKDALPTIRKHQSTFSSHDMLYIVSRGDNLDSISEKYHVKVDQIKQWNPVLQHAYIQSGEVIVIRQ